MTMKEINRISDMLNSKDEEMQNLGLLLSGWTRSDLYKYFRSIIIHKAKEQLARKAYLLGKLEGLKLLKNGGKCIENQSDASISG